MNPFVYKRPLFLLLLLQIIAISFFYHPHPSFDDVSHFISKTPVTIEGRVDSFAVRKQKEDNVLVSVSKLNGQPAKGKLYLRVEKDIPQWKDTLRFTGVLKEPYGLDIVGNFNWRRYLTYKKVFAEMHVQEIQVVRSAPWPYRAIRSLRKSILETFADHFSTPLPQIASGILLGERGDLSPELFSAFQDSGAIHLLVASGGNVGFVTLLTLAFCGFFSLNRRKSLIIALVVAGIYTLLAGADAPLARAYFMTVCAVTGYLLGRNSGVFQGLVVSCFLILLFHPAALFETGFQMSFLATFAIVLVLNIWKTPAQWPSWVRFFAQIFLATLATQLVLLPIFANVFYKVSLIGIVANMFLVPLASCLLGLSFAYYVAELLRIGFLLYFPLLWGLKLFAWLVEFFASFSFSSVMITAWKPVSLCAYYTGLFLLFHFPLRSFFRRCFWPGMVIIGLCLGISFFSPQPVRLYLLQQWNKHSVLVLFPHQTFVVGTELDASTLQASLYRLGRRRLNGVLHLSDRLPKTSLATLMPVDQEITPFSIGKWPDASFFFDPVTVTLRWPLYIDREGAIHTQKGYSGSKEDSVSYCFETATKDFCIGEHGRFVQLGSKIVFSERNKTVLLKI